MEMPLWILGQPKKHVPSRGAWAGLVQTSAQWILGEPEKHSPKRRQRAFRVETLELREVLTIGAPGLDGLVPVAQNDSYAATEDVPLVVAAPEGFLANDSGSAETTIAAVNSPTHGALAWNNDGSFTYTPDAEFFGEDSFTYQLSNSVGVSSLATVTVNVAFVNDAPVAGDDQFSLVYGQTAAGNIKANDVDAENEWLTVSLVSGPSSGNLHLGSDGWFVYTPTVNADYTDTVVYQIADPRGGIDTGTITIQVRSTGNHNPVAVDDSFDVTFGGTAAGNIKANDTDSDNDWLNVSLVSGPSNGNFYFGSDGWFVYSPTVNGDYTDSLVYQVADGRGGVDTGTITIHVTPVINHDPVATDDDFSVTYGGSAAGNIVSNDTDPDGDWLVVSLLGGGNSGDVYLGSDGWFVYTPTVNGNYTDTITYQVSDGRGGIDTGAISVDVSAIINHFPVAGDDRFILAYGQYVATNIMTNDTDPDGDYLTVAVLSGQSEGDMHFGTDGWFVYRPTADTNYTETISYLLSDGRGGFSQGTVLISVLSSHNQAPVAADLQYSIIEGSTLTGNTAGGTSGGIVDPDGDILSVELVAGPEHGVLSLAANGAFVYTPNEGFYGTDQFTVTGTDGQYVSNAATVAIVVTPKNLPPVAADNTYTVREDRTLAATVKRNILTNDSDPEGAALLASLVKGPEHGQLTLNADGTFSYTPDANFNGVDSFQYSATDGEMSGNVATVYLNVKSVNDRPVSGADSYTVKEDQSLTIDASAGVLANDSDVEGDALSALLTRGPKHGTVVLNADGSFTYVPKANFSGVDTFRYRATDGALKGHVTTVTINVQAVPDAPVAANDTYSVNEDRTLTIGKGRGVLSNDKDIDTRPISAVLVSGPSNGALRFNADGSFSYVPNDNFNGVDSFTYKATDGTSDSDIAVVTINVAAVNDDPEAANDSYAMKEGGKLVVGIADGVLANDSDIDGDKLSAVLAKGPAHGKLTLNADGSFTYTADAKYNGTDTFKYRTTDGDGNSQIATVTITVEAVNEAPVAKSDSYTVREDKTLNVSKGKGVLDNDVDGDDDNLTALLVKGPSNGTLKFNADGSFVYVPNANFNGVDTFTYKVSDGKVESEVTAVNITVAPVNDAPVANDDAYSVAKNGSIKVDAKSGVLANDSDVDGDKLTVKLVTNVKNGTLVLNADGSFAYTPKSGFVGTETFKYKVSDGDDESAVRTVTITVADPKTIASNSSSTSAIDALMNQVGKNGVLTALNF